MTTETKACIRGCAMFRRHLDDCDGHAPSGKPCRGCLPRRAQHGDLCDTCHRRLELMLHDAPGVDLWLTGNLLKGGQAREHEEKRTKSDSAAAPLQMQVLDQRDLIRDQLASWVDTLCEDVGLTGPKRHGISEDATFLRTWLTTVERQPWIADLWDELATSFSEAHGLAPWRPAVRRVPGVPCPNEDCGEVNLVIYGGESDVTCQTCRTMIRAEHFELWERIVEDDKRAAG